VVRRILDGQFQGHLVSDFYVGSNVYPGKHQCCWMHLLGNLHDLRRTHPLPDGMAVPEEPQDGEARSVAVQRWYRTAWALYDDAQQWVE
jgi:hypothetical protein